MPPDTRFLYLVYCAVALFLLREFNKQVTEPYMVCLSRLAVG